MNFHKHVNIGKLDLILSSGKRPKFFSYRKLGSLHLLDIGFIRILWNLPFKPVK